MSQGDRLIDAFLRVRRHIEVASNDPGRLKVRLRAGGLAATRGGDLKAFRRLFEAHPAVRRVQVKLLSAAAVIEYDAGRLGPDMWRRVLEGTEDEATDILNRLRQESA